MNTKRLSKDKKVKEWFATISAKENTREKYLDAMRIFTDMTGKTPDELIKEAIADIKSGKLMSERRVRSYLLQFKELLHSEKTKSGQQKYSASSAAQRWYTIISFYKAFDIDLPKNIKNGERVPKIENINPFFNREVIRKMVLHCGSIRNKSIILTMKSSGMAKREMTDVTYRHFREGYDRDAKIATIFMRRAKVGFDFITFIDKEGTEAILEYLKEDGRLTKEGYFDSHFDDTPLFTVLERKDKAVYYHPIKEKSFMAIFRHLSFKMQVHTPSKKGNTSKYTPLRSHNLRKFFRTALLHDGMDDTMINYMMAHKMSGVSGAYYIPDMEDLRKQYMQHMHALSINSDKPNIELIKDTMAAKVELEQSTMEIERLRAKLRELEGKDMNERENMLSLLDEFKRMIAKK